MASVRGESPELDVRGEIDALKALLNKPSPTPQEEQGDAIETTFAVREGFKPVLVFDAGQLRKEGAAEYYTVTFDGFIYSVVFASAPGSGSDILFTLEQWK